MKMTDENIYGLCGHGKMTSMTAPSPRLSSDPSTLRVMQLVQIRDLDATEIAAGLGSERGVCQTARQHPHIYSVK